MAEAFPLAWPAGWPRSTHRTRARYSYGQQYRYQCGAAPAAARDFLLAELERLKARHVVLSTNVELRRDGLPYANRTDPADPGVAVYFEIAGEQQCIPCDRWDRVADNMYAIGRTIAALRQLDRDGTHRMVSAAFSGFKALPERGSGPPWWEVLELAAGERDVEVIRAAYRQQARLHHPDAGGDEGRFHQVAEALRQALDVCRGTADG